MRSRRGGMKKKWLVHAILKCYACDWECEDYQKAEKEAKKHQKKTNHEIFGELGYGVEWS